MATLSQNAAEVASCATAIDAAIVAKGATTAGGLRNAAAAIATISTGATTTALTVTENGTYTAPTGQAYTPVTVNVQDWDGSSLKLLYDCETMPDTSLTLSTIRVPGGWNYLCEWGDGSSEILYGYNVYSHTYSTRGKYTIVIHTPTTGSEVVGFNPFPSNNAVTKLWLPVNYNINGNIKIERLEALYMPPTNNFTYMPPSSSAVSMQLFGTLSIGGTSCKLYARDYAYFGCNTLTLENCTTVESSEYVAANGTMGIQFLRFVQPEITGTSSNCFLFRWRSLKKILGVSKLTLPNPRRAFENCVSLKELPDTIDMSSADATTGFCTACTSLYKLPKNITVNVSLSFAPCTGVTDADSVATFDESGNITDGFVYNLNTCSNSGQTITLNSVIKALFDSTQQTAIETALTAKNWTLAW